MIEPQRDDLLAQLFWRDEILQAMYWMHGEGLGETLTSASLSSLLDTDAEHLDLELQRLEDDGYVAAAETGYRLTDLGLDAGKRSFSDEFADLTRSAHGACGPGCDCHRHPSRACRQAAGSRK